MRLDDFDQPIGDNAATGYQEIPMGTHQVFISKFEIKQTKPQDGSQPEDKFCFQLLKLDPNPQNKWMVIYKDFIIRDTVVPYLNAFLLLCGVPEDAKLSSFKAPTAREMLIDIQLQMKAYKKSGEEKIKIIFERKIEVPNFETLKAIALEGRQEKKNNVPF